MADAIVADSATPPPEGLPYAVMTPERQSLALEAAWELDELAHTLLRELNRGGPQRHEPLKYRPFAARVKELASVLIAALDDEVEGVAELRHRLRLVDDE